MAGALLNLDDADIIMDMRKLNGKPNSTKFDAFWSELSAFLEESTPAVDDWRRGEVLHMPFALSVRHLREEISSRLEKKFPNDPKPVPSEEWIRLQFWPRSPYTLSALHYTGRFKVKYCVQIRQIHKEHQDSRYVSVILKYVKAFVVRFAQYVQMVSIDDKAVVPVGEPDCPISTGVCAHNRSLGFKEGPKLAALDHDFHIHGIVPSVAFFVFTPESPSDSFYQGRAFVTLKDKVTQPSSALRHSAEITSIIRSHFSEAESGSTVKPVAVIVSDGGADHRVTFLSIQVALICLFKALDLDILVCIRTCPYQSRQNIAERVTVLQSKRANVFFYHTFALYALPAFLLVRIS